MYDYFVHFVEVTKVIFENSTHFWVNAKDKDIQKAITKALNLPSGEGVTVGEPLVPLLKRLCIASYYDYYKDINSDNLEECIKNCPNTVRIERYNDKTDTIPYYEADLGAQQLFEDTGNPSGSCATRLIDVICNFEEESDSTEE